MAPGNARTSSVLYQSHDAASCCWRLVRPSGCPTSTATSVPGYGRAAYDRGQDGCQPNSLDKVPAPSAAFAAYGCVACGVCVRACPTGALRFDQPGLAHSGAYVSDFTLVLNTSTALTAGGAPTSAHRASWSGRAGKTGVTWWLHRGPTRYGHCPALGAAAQASRRRRRRVLPGVPVPQPEPVQVPAARILHEISAVSAKVPSPLKPTSDGRTQALDPLVGPVAEMRLIGLRTRAFGPVTTAPRNDKLRG